VFEPGLREKRIGANHSYLALLSRLHGSHSMIRFEGRYTAIGVGIGCVRRVRRWYMRCAEDTQPQ
jgi:hypothetical protein